VKRYDHLAAMSTQFLYNLAGLPPRELLRSILRVFDTKGVTIPVGASANPSEIYTAFNKARKLIAEIAVAQCGTDCGRATS
jgi:hypothetical protein